MYAFLTLLSILVILFIIVKTTQKKEAFEGYVPLNTDSKPTLPTNIPAVVELPVGVQASDLPGPLPTAPYEQIGSNLPSPYKDPALIKTTRQRILNVLEQTKGFLAFQATEIEDRSDPTIQLPLNTARSDLERLQSEANVLQRNPGLTPHMTVLDIAQIEDNLAYLQKEVELIGSNRPFQSSKHDIDLEGFAGDYKLAQGSDGTSEISGFHGSSPDKTPANLSELADFSTRIQGAIVKLTASGTTDPIVQTRVGNLTVMKGEIDAIIAKLNSGKMQSSEVPILSSDIQKALPNLGDPTSPLMPILQQVAKSGALSEKMAKTLGSYAKTFLDNATAEVSFNVKYNGDNQQDVNNTLSNEFAARKSSLTQTGFPSPYDLEQVAAAPSLNSILSGPQVTDRWAQDPRAEGRTPATGDPRGNYTNTVNAGTFDWKSRCNAIVEQVKRRGLNPDDYGILPEGARTGPTFSWKGHTKMICTRLQTVHLNQMDEMCGCPPTNWKGWNA
jgi:hypothetical protein